MASVGQHSNAHWIVLDGHSDVRTNISIILHRAEAEGALKGILGYVDEDLVSTDFLGDNRYWYYTYYDPITFTILW
jgi:hypothetical protein